jgi:hypothetical protein
MHYTAKYNRAQLSVVHPQLNQVIPNQPFGEIKAGRKQFFQNKNFETSGHSASYGLPQVPDANPSAFKFRNAELEAYHPQASPPLKFQPRQNISKEVQVDLETSPLSKAERFYSQNNLVEKTGKAEIIEKETKNEEMLEEIGKIRKEIQKKEDEIQEFKRVLGNVHSQEEVFNRIDKNKWDKQFEAEKRIANKTLLDDQVFAKNQLKRIEEVEREKERNERLRQLIQLRNDQERERQEAMKKANHYFQELQVQHDLQKQIQTIENQQYWESIPRPKENPPPSSILHAGHISSQVSPRDHKASQLSPSKMFYFTKKQPKHLVFNAITGELKDFSCYDQKSFSHLKIRNASPGLDDRSFFKEAGNAIVMRRMSPVS